MKSLAFRNGDKMPALGLGTWKSRRGDVGGAVRAAIELGYRHIDCASIYGNEAEIGEALRSCFGDGLVTREDLFITSKLWSDAHAAEEVAPALRATLANLGLEYLDLYLMHWPVALRAGVVFPESGSDLLSLEELPLTATWAGLESAVDAGTTRHIGVSNFSLAKLQGLLTAAKRAPEVNQIELHPYLQQAEFVRACIDLGVIVTAYSPLGSADRPSNLKQEDEPILLEDAGIAAIASRLGSSSAQVLLAWAVQRGTSVIPKSVNRDRLAQNLAAAELTLSQADMDAIAAIDRKRRYVDGAFWCPEGSPYTISNLWDE